MFSSLHYLGICWSGLFTATDRERRSTPQHILEGMGEKARSWEIKKLGWKMRASNPNLSGLGTFKGALLGGNGDLVLPV
jgi:hypothetical protein